MTSTTPSVVVCPDIHLGKANEISGLSIPPPLEFEIDEDYVAPPSTIEKLQREDTLPSIDIEKEIQNYLENTNVVIPSNVNTSNKPSATTPSGVSVGTTAVMVAEKTTPVGTATAIIPEKGEEETPTITENINANPNSTSSKKTKRIERTAFSTERDIFLLKETIALNPYRYSNKRQKRIWTQISGHFNEEYNTCLDQRGVEGRIDRLLNKLINNKLKAPASKKDSLFPKKMKLLRELKKLKNRTKSSSDDEEMSRMDIANDIPTSINIVSAPPFDTDLPSQKVDHTLSVSIRNTPNSKSIPNETLPSNIPVLPLSNSNSINIVSSMDKTSKSKLLDNIKLKELIPSSSTCNTLNPKSSDHFLSFKKSHTPNSQSYSNTVNENKDVMGSTLTPSTSSSPSSPNAANISVSNPMLDSNIIIPGVQKSFDDSMKSLDSPLPPFIPSHGSQHSPHIPNSNFSNSNFHQQYIMDMDKWIQLRREELEVQRQRTRAEERRMEIDVRRMEIDANERLRRDERDAEERKLNNRLMLAILEKLGHGITN